MPSLHWVMRAVLLLLVLTDHTWQGAVCQKCTQW